MYRSYIDPKYTYITYAFNKQFPSTPQSSPNQWCIWNLDNDFSTSWVSNYTPVIPLKPLLPSLGTTRGNRIGNEITVSSIRIKLYMKMGIRWVQSHYGNFSHTQTEYDFDEEIDGAEAALYQTYFYDCPGLANYPVRDRWFKMRIFCVQFDEGVDITPRYIRNWFFSTFFPYYVKDNVSHQPTSVHSNLLNQNNPFAGRFNILLDKCMTMHSNRSSISLDLTLPLKKRFKFNEGDGTLIGPNILTFIVPPLSIEYDVDQQSRHELESNTAYRDAIDFLNGHALVKLNYTDL